MTAVRFGAIVTVAAYGLPLLGLLVAGLLGVLVVVVALFLLVAAVVPGEGRR